MNNQEYQELGRKSFTSSGHSADEYRKLFGLKPEDQRIGKHEISYGEKWTLFLEGWNESHIIFKDQQRKEYKVDEFLSELTDLCKKYQVSLYSGCGCCGAGGYVKDYEFHLDINDLEVKGE